MSAATFTPDQQRMAQLLKLKLGAAAPGSLASVAMPGGINKTVDANGKTTYSNTTPGVYTPSPPTPGNGLSNPYALGSLQQAAQAMGQGNIAQGAGIAARGLLTAPAVNAAQMFNNAQGALSPLASGVGNAVGNFASGLSGAPLAAAKDAASVSAWNKNAQQTSSPMGAGAVNPYTGQAFGMGNRSDDGTQSIAPAPQQGMTVQNGNQSVDAGTIGMPPGITKTVGANGQMSYSNVAAGSPQALGIMPAGVGLASPSPGGVYGRPNPGGYNDNEMSLLPQLNRAGFTDSSGHVYGGGGDGGGQAGYRGPQATGSAYGTPGPGNFDESALAFAARSSDPKERAKVPGLVSAIGQRQATEGNNIGFTNANANTLALAQAGELGARGSEQRARATQIGALTPAQVAQGFAQSGLTQAQTGLAQTQTTGLAGLQQGAQALQGQAIQGGELNLAQHTAMNKMLSDAFASGDPTRIAQAQEAARTYAGKPGNATQEDRIKAYTGYVDSHMRAFAMLGDSAPPAMTPDQFFAASNAATGTVPTATGKTVSKVDYQAMVKQAGDESKVKKILAANGLTVGN